MLPKPVMDAAMEIGKFYLNKHKGDYAAAEKELFALLISKIEIQGDKLCITAGRVGRLIGPRGSNIDALNKHIEDKFYMHIHIIEDMDCLYDFLIPRKDEDY